MSCKVAVPVLNAPEYYYNTIAYRFCMVEEIRGPAVISFPDSVLKEGKMSGVATFLHNYLQERGGGGERGREKY